MNRMTIGLAVLFGAGAVAQADLVMHFSFDQTTMIDSNGLKTISADVGSNGTIEANAGDFANKSVAGKFGNAVTLDGSDYVDLSANASSLSSLTNGTIAFWFNTTAGFGTFVSGSDASDPSSEIRVFPLSTGGTIGYESRNDETTLFQEWSTTGGKNDGTWRHVTAVTRGTDVELYIDGAKQTNQATAGSGFFGDVDGLDTLLVGANRDSGGFTWFYTGAIDDLAIYDHALSQGEIDALQTAAIPEPSTGLVALLGLTALFLRARRRQKR
jgi:MYXO-CTERM domain-containing protein